MKLSCINHLAGEITDTMKHETEVCCMLSIVPGLPRMERTNCTAIPVTKGPRCGGAKVEIKYPKPVATQAWKMNRKQTSNTESKDAG